MAFGILWGSWACPGAPLGRLPDQTLIFYDFSVIYNAIWESLLRSISVFFHKEKSRRRFWIGCWMCFFRSDFIIDFPWMLRSLGTEKSSKTIVLSSKIKVSPKYRKSGSEIDFSSILGPGGYPQKPENPPRDPKIDILKPWGQAPARKLDF